MQKSCTGKIKVVALHQIFKPPKNTEMKYYILEQEIGFSQFQVIRVSFGEPATNSVIVQEVEQTAPTIASRCHGKVVLFNGAASNAVTAVLAHKFGHVTKAVGIYDPKLQSYVIVISHDPDYFVGRELKLSEIH